MVDSASIRERFELLSPQLDERERRLFAATEARAAGRGGLAAVSRITGIARSTIAEAPHDPRRPPRRGHRRLGRYPLGDTPEEAKRPDVLNQKAAELAERVRSGKVKLLR